jgi:hypothetical protein
MLPVIAKDKVIEIKIVEKKWEKCQVRMIVQREIGKDCYISFELSNLNSFKAFI